MVIQFGYGPPLSEADRTLKFAPAPVSFLKTLKTTKVKRGRTTRVTELLVDYFPDSQQDSSIERNQNAKPFVSWYEETDLSLYYEPTADTVKECGLCGRFFLYCGSCETKRKLDELPRESLAYELGIPCHDTQLIFTDGSCLNNGRPNAKAGVGIAWGMWSYWANWDQRSVSITDENDGLSQRTSARAELLAAILGLTSFTQARKVQPKPICGDAARWVIATDSEYVVKGITEWFPMWKVCTKKRFILVKEVSVDRGAFSYSRVHRAR